MLSHALLCSHAWAPGRLPASKLPMNGAGPQVPIMLRSTYCCLNEHSDKELTDLGECPYDQASSLLVQLSLQPSKEAL